MATTSTSRFSAPILECDLVMKGGITSGVVYPLAVCELASVYRLRSVGGSSAGAIAAAAAAAAELGREAGGFEKLATLPQDLSAPVAGDDSRLFSLFQPEASMARLFRLVTAGLGSGGMPRALTTVLAALAAYWPAALLGACFGLVVVVLSVVLGGGAAWVGVVAGIVLVLAGAALGVLLGALADLRRLPDVGFGLCSGLSRSGARTPALTPWLHGLLQDLAGRGVDGPPLTFGDLADAGITLQLMTTNLTRRQPLSMPWSASGYYFDPARFRELFPEEVVAHLESSVAPPTGDALEDFLAAVGREQALPLRPFPAPRDLPVIVAVRMSLSFPGLIAAVPLHAVDFSQEVDKKSREAQRVWHSEHPDGGAREAAAAVPPLELRVNWFSDGGICANLPLHFFDSALPRRPTFAIDLADFPPDRPKSSDQFENSYLPATNSAGLHRRQTVWTGHGLGALVEFVGSIVETARTWVDEAQLSMPGYRDRIVTVWTSPDEGGLNLDMPEQTVLELSERGEGAARRLVDRFAGEQPGVVPAPGWDNQRWIRFRTSTAGLSGWLLQLRRGYADQRPGTTPYATWVGVDETGQEADATLPSYPIEGTRRHAANVRTEGLIDTAEQWQESPADAFTEGAPRPRPAMKLVPQERVGEPPI